MFSGQPDVATLIRHRLQSSSTRGDRQDNWRLAIAIEGGGMRGIVSAATAKAVADAGLLPAVDLIVGTSAGAQNAAALAAGVIDPFTAAYADMFTDTKYVDVKRLRRREPIIDIRGLCADIEAEFEFTQLINDPAACPIAFVATDVDSAQAEILTDFSDPDDFMQSLIASGLLPLLAGSPLELRGRRWIDGGVGEAIGVQSAQQLGATHVLVLATRALGTGPSRSPFDFLVEQYLQRLNPELRQLYRSRPDRYRELTSCVAADAVAGVRTTILAPAPSDPLPSRLERDPGAIQAAQHAAIASTTAQLSSLLGDVAA